MISCENGNRKSIYNETIVEAKYSLFSNTEKLQYLDSVIKKVNTFEIDSLKTKYLFELAVEYYKLSEIKSSFKIGNTIYRNAIKNNDSLTMGRAMYFMGTCLHNSQKDSAYYYYKESEKFFRLTKNDDRLTNVLYNKADLLFYEGNYTESEIETFKALTNIKTNQNPDLEYRCYAHQGNNHLKLGELDKALFYFEEAEKVLSKLIQEKGLSDEYYLYKVINITDICNVYDEKGQYDKSVDELEKIATTKLKTKFSKYYSIVIGNIAYSLMKKGNYKEAQKHYNEAIETSKQNHDDQGYLYKIINYGEFCLLTKDHLKAKRYLHEGLKLSKSLKNGDEMLKALNLLSQTDKSNALFYKNEYIRISDSLINKQRANREKFARIEYETGKIEDQNKVLSNRNLILLLTIAVIVIIFLIFSSIYYRKTKRKEINLLEQKNVADNELFNLLTDFQEEVSSARNQVQSRISKELHDGIMNQIYGIRLNLGILNKMDDDESKQKRLAFVRDLQKVETEIRNLSHDLSNDSLLNKADFSFLLNALIDFNNSSFETDFTISISEKMDWDKYSSLIKINIYRVLQELFQNVNKYAHAKNCEVTIKEENNLLTLMVKDDGIGFDIAETKNGIGLKNIEERAKTTNADLKIDSKINEGTTVELIYMSS